MHSIPAENRELDALDIHQPKESLPRLHEPRHGVLLGTDFRHAVEFSKSGRTETRPFRAPSLAGCPTLRRFPATPHPGGWPGRPSGPRGAHRTLHHPQRPCTGGPESGVRSLGRMAQHAWWGPLSTTQCGLAHRIEGERTAAVTRLRQGGTARSPGGRRASPSWGWSAPRCAGRIRP
jgi:hypothetical protein